MQGLWRVVAVMLALAALAQIGAPARVTVPAARPALLRWSPLELADLAPVLWSENSPAALEVSPAHCLCFRALDEIGRYRLLTHQTETWKQASTAASGSEVDNAGFYQNGSQ